MTQSDSSVRPEPERIGVFRALQLGDMLCAVPALRALRRAYPSAEITLIGLPWAVEFAERFEHYIDDMLVFPGWPGLPERAIDFANVPPFLEAAQRRNFDLVVQMHGDGRVTNAVAALLGAKRIVGACANDASRPDNGCFAPYPDWMPERGRPLAALDPLGIQAASHDLEFPLLSRDREELNQLFQPRGNSDVVVLHPGARSPTRRWPAVYFAAVGDALAEQGLQVVVTGSGEERDLCDEMAASMRSSPTILAGETTLGALAALVDSASLVVCNDTGISHLADALKTPSVVLFTGSDAGRWAPHDVARHRAVVHPETMDPQRVLAHAQDLLERRLTYAR